MSATDDLVRHAEQYASGFDKGTLPHPPGKHVAVVACMDARFLVGRVFGVEEGDIHVIRNAGGIVTDDVIRSLAISQHRLGTTAVVIVHHTECGMLTFTDDEFADQLQAASGQRPSWPVGAFADLDGSVRESVRRIVSSPFLPATEDVRGFVYDVRTGRLREVPPVPAG